MSSMVSNRLHLASPVSLKTEEEDDDFEKELAYFIENEEKERNNKKILEIKKQVEKGEKEQREKEIAKDTIETDNFNFTSDQQRAMDELLAQQEDDFIGEEEPPEYNVKERLLQLNAELANDPTPLESIHRDVKIKFKENLVDLVAPPPDFNDNEEEKVCLTPSSCETTEDNKNVISTLNGENKERKFVIERDGKFEVLQADEMTSMERRLYDVDSEKNDSAIETKMVSNKNNINSPKTNSKKTNPCNVNNNSSDARGTKHPTPPSKPRPVTAAHRNVRPATATNTSSTTKISSTRPRPRSAAVPLTNSSPLENFTYQSPYALSESDKKLSRQQTQHMEEQRKKEEDEEKRGKKEKQKELDGIFQSWLLKKKEEEKRKKKEELEKKKMEKKEDKSHGGELQTSSFKSSETNQTEQNKQMFNNWIILKENQLKHEKLLKKRKEQEMKEGYVVHNKEECEKTFKSWLRKKNAEVRKKKHVERQKMRLVRLAARKSRKSQALARAILNSQSYKYVDFNY